MTTLTPLQKYRRKNVQKVRYLLYVRPRSVTHRFQKWPRGKSGCTWAGVTTGGQGWAHAEGDKMTAEEAATAKKIFRDCYGVGFEFRREKVK